MILRNEIIKHYKLKPIKTLPKPRAPYKPTAPLEILERYLVFEITDLFQGTFSFDEFLLKLDEVRKKYDGREIKISLTNDDGYCDEYSNPPKVEILIKEMEKNPNYDRDNENYKKELKEYNKKYKEYKQKLEIWKEKMVPINEKIKEQEEFIKSKEKEIEKIFLGEKKINET